MAEVNLIDNDEWGVVPSGKTLTIDSQNDYLVIRYLAIPGGSISWVVVADGPFLVQSKNRRLFFTATRDWSEAKSGHNGHSDRWSFDGAEKIVNSAWVWVKAIGQPVHLRVFSNDSLAFLVGVKIEF